MNRLQLESPSHFSPGMGEDQPVLTDSRLQYNRQNVAALYRIQKALMTNNLDVFKGFIVFGCAALHYTFRQRSS
jgi:hypothetical protein